MTEQMSKLIPCRYTTFGTPCIIVLWYTHNSLDTICYCIIIHKQFLGLPVLLYYCIHRIPGTPCIIVLSYTHYSWYSLYYCIIVYTEFLGHPVLLYYRTHNSWDSLYYCIIVYTEFLGYPALLYYRTHTIPVNVCSALNYSPFMADISRFMRRLQQGQLMRPHPH